MNQSIKDLEVQLGFQWQEGLVFEKETYKSKAMKRAELAMRKKELTLRQRWLSVRYQNEVREGRSPRWGIRWIDDVFGYGVFSDQEIPLGAFIGEYTGIIRKRKKRIVRKNDYCFEYAIGDWARNPFLIDAKERGNFTRFINHSEEANVEAMAVFVDGLMHIVLVALKPIPKGEQLCYHYGDIFWRKRRHEKKGLTSL